MPGRYFEIRRVWQAGDFVDLDLPMPPRLMEANPLVEEDANQVAIQRGPVVYCLESPDLPHGTRLSDVMIPANIHLTARYDQRLLDGVVVLEGQALARPAENWKGKLYREFQPAGLRSGQCPVHSLLRLGQSRAVGNVRLAAFGCCRKLKAVCRKSNLRPDQTGLKYD